MEDFSRVRNFSKINQHITKIKDFEKIPFVNVLKNH